MEQTATVSRETILMLRSQYVSDESADERLVLNPPFGKRTKLDLSLDMRLESFYSDVLTPRYGIHPGQKYIQVFRRGRHAGIRLDLCQLNATLRECGLMDDDVLGWGVGY